MTVKEIIKETETLSPNEQQNLLYYFLYSTLKEEKQKEFFKLINKKEDKEQKIKNPLDSFMKYKGILENIDISDITEEEIYLQGD